MNGTCCCVELTVTEDAEVLLSVAEDSQVGLDVEEQFVDGGGGITPTGTKTINVTENGTTNTDVTYYANAKVVANVPNTYAAADEGKVVQDGDLESQTTATFEANDTYDTTTIKQVTVDVPASAVDSGYVYINENDTVNVVGYAQAVVDVPNTYTEYDEGKVVDDGELVAQTSEEYTANGTYDTTTISEVTVAVSGGEPTGTKEISITANGTTTEDVGAYAYAEITANVPNTYAAADEGKVVDDGALVAQTSVTKTTNGTYDTTLNNEVVINVPTGTARTSADLTASGDTVTVPAGLYASNATKAVAAGTAGTPTATKGTVSNHSVSVTPSVTNTSGYITGSTKTGTAVTVTAAELDSGTKNISANGNNQDVVGYAAVNVNVPNSYSASDEGKVVSNGALVAQTSDTVTTNDTYDTTLINSLTVNVSGGGTTEPEPLDVDLVDYDGTLLHTYTKADFLALDSLPANPSHSGLVAQGWNWTLTDAKTYVTAHGTLVIGQSYRTDDGKTRFYISIPDGVYPDFELNLFVETGYNATVAWGDGNTDTVAGKASYSGISHTYNSSGDYLITVTCEGELQFGCTGTNVSVFAPNAGYSYRGSFLKKVELSNNVTRIYRTAFLNAFALESISIPTSVENMRGDEFTSAANMFANAYALKGIVVPAGCPCIGGSMFTYSAVKYISLPKATFSVSNSPNGSFANTCGCLRKLTFPDGMSSSVAMNITNNCSGIKRFVVMGNITSLGSDYFKNNASLPRLDIPSTVTSIAANAFNGNRGVREYHFHSTTPPTLSNTNAFGNQNSRGFTIYVPYSADHSVLNAYKTASNWSTYASNIQEESA